MKKLVNLILTISILTTLYCFFNKTTVYAANYNLYCENNYEVSNVNDLGEFDKISCHNTFEEANEIMKQSGDDAVIRHVNSLSPTKIIALNQGVAYSYSARSNSDTLTIMQDYPYSHNRKTTYVTKHRELALPTTINYDGNGNGRVDVMLVGFDGFVDLKNIDLVPMKYINNKLPITLGGNTSDESDEEPFVIIPKQSHYEIEKNGNYIDLVYYAYSGWAEDVKPREYKMIVGPAPKELMLDQIYYSHDHQNFYSDNKYTNFVVEHFNYYQYLPLRSQSNISATTYDSYLARYGYNAKPSSNNFANLKKNESQLYNEAQNFINNQNLYGVNALMTFAIAINESGYGRSYYAITKNNLFGWQAFDSDPNNAFHFESIETSVRDQMGINFRGYLDTIDFRFFGMHLGNKGSGFNVKYASDPYWGLKAAAIAYEIDKTDNGHDGTLTDYNNYQLGLIEERVDVNLNKSTNGSTKLFNTEYGSTYYKNYTTLIKEISDYTKIQIQNALKDNLIYKHTNGGNTQPLYQYDFNRDVGYVLNNKIRVINDTQIVTPPVDDGITPSGKYKFEILSFTNNLQYLNIKGISYQPGIYVENSDAINQKLIIKGSKEPIEIELINLYNDELHYNFTSFSKSYYDLSLLENDIYEFSVKTTHELYQEDNILNFIYDSSFEYNHRIFKFYNENDKLLLEIKDKEYPEVFIDHNWYLYNANIDENNILNISGISQLQGLNNDSESTLHQLLFVDINDPNNFMTYDLEFGEPQYDITNSFNDGHVYSHSWYQGSIDISNIDYGDYFIKIKTTVDDIEKQSLIFAPNSYLDNELKNINGKYYYLYSEYDYSNRLELSVNKSSLDINDVNPLTYRKPFTSIVDFGYNQEKNSLNISGVNFIWNIDSSIDSIGTIYLLNRDTGEIFNQTFTYLNALDNGLSFDINSVVQDDNYDYNNSWFTTDFSLDNITDGNYDIILSISNSNTIQYYVADYKSVLNDIDYISDDLSKHFKASINNENKYRISLDIKGLSKTIIEGDVSTDTNTDITTNKTPSFDTDPNTDSE